MIPATGKTYNHHINEMGSGLDIHGQQVGWHALFITAAKLIEDNPVTNDALYPDDPWNRWLREYTLNRKDGLWLADGMDRAPLNSLAVVLEKGREGLF